MHFSKKTFKEIAPLYEAILALPFNQALMQGTLDTTVFSFYIEQDRLYLQDYGRALAIIAAKSESQYIQNFLDFAKGAVLTEQELVHGYFKQKYDYQDTGTLTPATIAYTSFLLKTALLEPVEVAVAAILPCFWVYREVGLYIAKHTKENNPFARWISTYADDAFSKSVDEAITIFDALALDASDSMLQKMTDAFYKSTCLEWHFWNDAYGLANVDPLAG
jgi:thiaminase (transcriptional activator TenA)